MNSKTQLIIHSMHTTSGLRYLWHFQRNRKIHMNQNGMVSQDGKESLIHTMILAGFVKKGVM